MKRIQLLLLLALLAMPVFVEVNLVTEAVKILRSQGAGRAQGDFQMYFDLEFYGGGTAILSLFGLHCCARTGLVGRHPVHIGFIATTLSPFFIYAAFRFLWTRT